MTIMATLAVCSNIFITSTANVQAGGTVKFPGPPDILGKHIIGESFNYIVPTAKIFRIKSALFVSNPSNNSFAVIYVNNQSATVPLSMQLFAISERLANPKFEPGIEIPEKWMIHGAFMNLSTQDQGMQIIINGEICDK